MAASYRHPTPAAWHWRILDIVVASVLSVSAGLIFVFWNIASNPIVAPLGALLPGLQALASGGWLFAGIVCALVIRKPGAAFYGEVVAATVSALIGNQWGVMTIGSGIVQGLGAELIFAIFLYRSWHIATAMLAGAAAGLALAINDLLLWYPGTTTTFAAIYTVSAITSGALIAGLLSWFVVRGLARTGTLSRFAAGRTSTSSTPR